jgi:hypothetical protein
MADTKHYSTADYEERAQKLKRLLEYRNLLKSLGLPDQWIDNSALPNREESILEILAKQPTYKPVNLEDKGSFPGALADYGKERGLHIGTQDHYNRPDMKDEVYFPSYDYLKGQYKDLYRYQADLYHRPEEYFKNLDMARVRFRPLEKRDDNPDAIYFGQRDLIDMGTPQRAGYDILVHEQEHRNQQKYPTTAYSTGPKREHAKDTNEHIKAVGRFSESEDKQIEALNKSKIRYTFDGYSGQKEDWEKRAEIRRLQSLQPRRDEIPFTSLPVGPLEQGGMRLKPIKKR